MKTEDLKDSARECLAAAFKAKPADSVPQPHILQAAVQVLLLPADKALDLTPRKVEPGE